MQISVNQVLSTDANLVVRLFFGEFLQRIHLAHIPGKIEINRSEHAIVGYAPNHNIPIAGIFALATRHYKIEPFFIVAQEGLNLAFFVYRFIQKILIQNCSLSAQAKTLCVIDSLWRIVVR